jgi:hypothetical protein
MSDTIIAPVQHTQTRDEEGTTNADARRLAARASRVFVHYRSDSNIPSLTKCLSMTVESFLDAIDTHPDAEPMMVRLWHAIEGELWLQVG